MAAAKSFVGQTLGTWHIESISGKKTSSGGAFFNVTCNECGAKAERNAQQVVKGTAGCSNCRAVKVKIAPIRQGEKRIIIVHDNAPLALVENTNFETWVKTVSGVVLNFYEKIGAKVFEGDTRLGFKDPTPDPWTRARAIFEGQIAEGISRSIESPIAPPPNPTPEGPHLKIRKEHQVFFNGEATTPPPSYIVAWAENTPNVAELEFRFMPGDDEYCYVLWSKIEVKQEAIPELVNNDHLPFGF